MSDLQEYGYYLRIPKPKINFILLTQHIVEGKAALGVGDKYVFASRVWIKDYSSKAKIGKHCRAKEKSSAREGLVTKIQAFEWRVWTNKN